MLRASGHSPAIAFVESERARLWLRRGDLAESEASLLEIRARAEEAGEAANVLNSTLLIADVKLGQGDHEAAAGLIDSAEEEGGELVAA